MSFCVGHCIGAQAISSHVYAPCKCLLCSSARDANSPSLPNACARLKLGSTATRRSLPEQMPQEMTWHHGGAQPTPTEEAAGAAATFTARTDRSPPQHGSPPGQRATATLSAPAQV